MATIHRQIFYEGRVQGVGFRWTVRQIAAGYEVVGWVRNLADGRVEMRVSGERVEIEAFLEAVQSSPLGAHIRRVLQSDLAAAPDPPTTGFSIRH